MRKIILVALGIAVLTLVAVKLYGSRDYEIVNYPKEISTIVAFGDSLVEGIGSTSGKDMVSVLSRDTGFDIVNLGRGGDTTEDALDRIEEVLILEPDLSIVLLGGNDYLRRISKDQTFNNLEEIIQRLQRQGSIVLVLGVKGGVIRDSYKKHFRKLVRDNGTAYVPNILDGIIGKSENLSDQIHPNDRGYELMAERVEPVLSTLFE